VTFAHFSIHSLITSWSFIIPLKIPPMGTWLIYLSKIGILVSRAHPHGKGGASSFHTWRLPIYPSAPATCALGQYSYSIHNFGAISLKMPVCLSVSPHLPLALHVHPEREHHVHSPQLALPGCHRLQELQITLRPCAEGYLGFPETLNPTPSTLRPCR
jgi:hypothetical protein